MAMIAPSTEAIEAEPEDSAEMKMTVENTAVDNNNFDSSYTQSHLQKPLLSLILLQH